MPVPYDDLGTLYDDPSPTYDGGGGDTTVAGRAEGAGAAHNASVNVGPSASTATASGVAIATAYPVFPERATGTAAALNASIRVGASAGTGAGSGSAPNQQVYQPVPWVGVFSSQIGAEVTQPGRIALGAVDRRFFSLGLDAVIAESFGGDLDLDAIVHKVITESFAIDSEISTTERKVFGFPFEAYIDFDAETGTFGLDAYFIGSLGHSREFDHFGTQPIDVITYLGTPLDEVLFDLYDMIAEVEAPHFSLEAYIGLYFSIEALIHKAGAGGFGMDAWVSSGGSLSINSILQATYAHSTSINAYVVAI